MMELLAKNWMAEKIDLKKKKMFELELDYN